MRDLSSAISQSLFKKTKGGTSSAFHFNLTLVVFIMMFGFLYIFQINALGTKGYEIRQIEQRVKVLQAENKELQIQSSSLSSITRIQQDAETLNMVPATNVTYIKDADFALK